MKKALLLINQKSRDGSDHYDCIVQKLEKKGIRCIIPGGPVKEIDEVIAEHADSVDLVILGGGDGTLNLAAQALIDNKVTLGVLPLGTANDLSRTLGIPGDLDKAIETIVEGKPVSINVGLVNGNVFFNVANIGFGVQVNRKLGKNLKKRWGSVSYLIAALKAFWYYKPFRVRIRAGDKDRKMHVVQLAVGNGCFYGGGMRVHEDADIREDHLSVYLIKPSDFFGLLLNSRNFVDGKFENIQGIEHLKSDNLTIYTRRPKRIMADGECVARTPAAFSILRNAITVMVPGGDSNQRLPHVN